MTTAPIPQVRPARIPLVRRLPGTVGSAVIGAIDGLLGIALPFAAFTAIAVLAWAGLGTPTDWMPFVRGAAVAQLLGHGVAVRFAAPGAGFTATVALLGPAVITALAAARAGRRAAATASPTAAWAAAVVATAAAAAGLAWVATSPAATPVAWQAVLVPTALFGAVALLALRAARPGAPPLPAGVRTGIAATALLLAAAAVGVAALLLLRFADVIGLAESLSAGPLGGLALTAAQVLAIPALVVWGAAWATGAGVALGTGSVAGPFATQIGPLPALPVLGAIPPTVPAAAAAIVLLPVLAGFAAAAIARRSGIRASALPLGLVTGATAGVALGLLAAAASGAAGPGRFQQVGPSPLLTGLLAAVEIGLPAVLAAAVVCPAAAPEAPEAAQ